MTITSRIDILRQPKQGRNQHLVPEINERSKRILDQAKQECLAAFDAYSNPLEIWNPKINGRECTCNSIVEPMEKKLVNETSLSSFLFENTYEFHSSDFCPICFNQKYVGGYDKTNYLSIILDSTSSPILIKASLIKDKPYWYKAINGSVTWKFFVPSFFSDYEVCIRWNEEPKIWSLTVNDLSLDNIVNFIGEEVELKLNIRDSTNSKAGVYAIFIYFKINSKTINSDMPRHTLSFTGELNVVDETQSSIAVNIPGNNINTKSVVIDQDGFIYRIIEVEHNDPYKIWISNNCQARLVRSFERIYLLPSKLIKKYYNPQFTFL